MYQEFFNALNSYNSFDSHNKPMNKTYEIDTLSIPISQKRKTRSEMLSNLPKETSLSKWKS